MTCNDIMQFDSYDRLSAAAKNRLLYLIYRKPNPILRSKYWKKSFNDVVNVDLSIKSVDLNVYFSDCHRYKELLLRKDCDLLLFEIYRAITFFEKLILVESNICKPITGEQNGYHVDGIGYYVADDSYTIKSALKYQAKAYVSHLLSFNMVDDLMLYVNNIRAKKRKNTPQNHVISRAQYCSIIMYLASLPDNQIEEALTICGDNISGIIRRKPTKQLIYTLCCVIFDLLIKHAKNSKQRGKGYCRTITADLVTWLSPKKPDNTPYYVVTEGTVEVALTEK